MKLKLNYDEFREIVEADCLGESVSFGWKETAGQMFAMCRSEYGVKIIQHAALVILIEEYVKKGDIGVASKVVLKYRKGEYTADIELT